MVGIHGEYGNIQLPIYLHVLIYHKNKNKNVLHFLIALFGHRLISKFLNACELLLAGGA
jgi:hypothetical protein